MKILIAEDDPVSVKILQYTLQHFGHEVVTAASGTEAWEMFDREPVRAIVSDWMMTVPSPVTPRTRVGRRRRTPSTPTPPPTTPMRIRSRRRWVSRLLTS